MMGISKRELFEDYYLDEFLSVSEQYYKMKQVPDQEEAFIDQLGI